jgi:hypothetical protein
MPDAPTNPTLTPEHASRFAALALRGNFTE